MDDIWVLWVVDWIVNCYTEGEQSIVRLQATIIIVAFRITINSYFLTL